MDPIDDLLIPPPRRVPWLLRPALWLARRMTGQDPLPARLLAWWPKSAFGAGVFEVAAAGPGDLDPRCLAIARLVASRTAGCPFCVDMNAAAAARGVLTDAEIDALLVAAPNDGGGFVPRDDREAAAAAFARALSLTPVQVSADLRARLRASFSSREIVVLTSTVAQVNFWSRFNQGLDIPAAGFSARTGR
ncbi:carboxymuconolactone decarboxylase family protein [Myxococcota bacterium]|nr:carboxymuconolactone decarboxylase family protein [Myxococcota bacterium]